MNTPRVALRLPRLRQEAVVSALALLAPVLLVQGVRTIFGAGGPSVSAAAPAATDQSPEPLAPVVRLTPQQARALDWARQRAGQAPLVSPLQRAQPAPVTTPEPDTARAPEPTDAPAPDFQGPQATLPEPQVPEQLTRLRFTGFATLKSGPIAAINGRPHRVGDTVITGWTIEAIDTDKRVVTLRSADGLLVELDQSTN
jgi:hypothetical protein